HPLPLLIRQGRVVGDLPCPPTPPWGILPETEPNVASVRLEPGDSVLIYTDGVIEARTAGGEEFGLDRLVDLTQRHASDLSRPARIVRRIVESVQAHQEELTDDATAVFVRYAGDHPS